MANPWDNDPIVSPSPFQTVTIGRRDPAKAAAERRAERDQQLQEENTARTAANERQRIAMERARLQADLQSKGLMLDASGNVVPLQSSAPPVDPSLTGDAFLKTLSGQDAAQVKALAEGRMAFPTGKAATSPYWQQKIEQVSQYDPTFDAINYNARAATRRDFTSGVSSRNIKALNTAIGHVGQLAGQISGTAAHGGFPGATLLNKAENAISRSTGSAGITKYEQTAAAVASELTQVFRGTTGAEADVKRFISELDSAGSDEQKQAAIQNIMGLLKSRLDALNDQYTKGMGTTAQPLDLLDEHSKKALASYLPGFSANGDSGGDLGGGGGPLAGGGDSEKSIPIPPEMQAANLAYYRAHSGHLDPDAYANFRASLDDQYGFGHPDEAKMEAYRKFARDANQPGAHVNAAIGPVDKEMTGRDKFNASLFNNPLGAAVLGAGSLGGGMDEVAGTLKGLATGVPIGTSIAQTDAMMKASADKYPVSSALGNLGGSVALGAVTGGLGPAWLSEAAGTLPGALGIGAGYGAASGALSNNDDRFGGAVGGGMMGLAGGAAGKYVAGPAAEYLMRTKGGQALSDAALGTFNRVTGKNVTRAAIPELSPIEAAAMGVKPDVAAVSQNLRDAAGLNLPYALADADPKLRMLGGAVTRKSVNARDLAERTFDPRAMDQGDRAMTGIESLLSPTTNLADRRQYWRDTANAQARPLYEQAFQGGSTAPLENQLGEAFNASSQAVADARAAVAEAERNLTLSKAGVSRAGNNVYMNSSALPADRAAQAALEGAQQRLAQAEAGHAQVLDRLRGAQADATSNAPGAVWNPRLQQFIDDPLSKSGLARGMEIQRLEALAENRPFNPTEYAVVGTDQAGNPIVGNVPNMRTMDAIKKGYDAILDDYPKDLRGNPIFDQRGRAITMAKQALVKELDAVNPDYAAARDAYGTFARHGEALNAGYDAAPRGTYARDIGPQLQNYSPSLLDEYRQGYATRLRDMVSDAGDSSDPYKLIYGGNERQAKIGTVFPEGAPKFDRLYQLEGDMTKTRGETLGGSPTAGRLQADEQLNGGLGTAALDAASQIATGGGLSLGTALRAGKQAMGDSLKLGVGEAARKRADLLSSVLFDTSNPASVADMVDAMGQKYADLAARKAAYARQAALLGAIAAPSLTVGRN